MNAQADSQGTQNSWSFKHHSLQAGAVPHTFSNPYMGHNTSCSLQQFISILYIQKQARWPSRKEHSSLS